MARGIAVTIGLNAVDPNGYEGWGGALTACEADARNMCDIARSRGFVTTTLLTRAATRGAVLSAIAGAAKTLKGGDIFLITYSGHGGQIPDKNGDEPDMEDETWCLYDGEVIDDQLAVAWTMFAPGVRVLVTSDSCHSGSVTRLAYGLSASGAPHDPRGSAGAAHGAAPRYRAMPPDVAVRTYYAHRKMYDQVQEQTAKDLKKPIRATVMLLAGCHDNQLSSDGAFNGLFTARLLQVWNGGRFAGSYREFVRAIVKKMPPTQVPEYSVIGASNPAFEAQTPFFVPALRAPQTARRRAARRR
jgi:hypothetical protein